MNKDPMSMEIVSAPRGGRVVAIGVFDGVHIGHRSIVSSAVAEASATGARPTVVTFHPHPESVLRPSVAPRYLTSSERKVELLRGLGVEEVVTVPFDKRFAQLSPEAFCGSVLSSRLGACSVFVGENFHFGKGGKGSPKDLIEYGRTHGFTVKTMELLRDDKGAISSTRIRESLADGDIRAASALLGRAHRLEGVVVHGAARGRSLGAPTANLRILEDLVVPREGVYVTKTRLAGGGVCDSVTSVGTNPTFGDGDDRNVETLLLDYEGELYGERLAIDFLERLRAQIAFADVEALREQIQEDIMQARKLHEQTKRSVPR